MSHLMGTLCSVSKHGKLQNNGPTIICVPPQNLLFQPKKMIIGDNHI